jgi:Transposase DDE domain
MSISVAELQPTLHDLFYDTAETLARQTGFCRRQRKLTGPCFAQTLVFSLLENPAATLDDFADHAATTVSPQAFDQRFTEAAACFLQELFLEAFNRSFDSARPAVLPFLRRFQGVYLRDATLVCLPAGWADYSRGGGAPHAAHGQAAAIKLVFEAELTTGVLTDVSLQAGLDNDKLSEVAGKPLPKGALLLEDMGFLSGDRLQHYSDQGVYVVTRIPAWTAVFAANGKRLDLVKELRKAKGWRYERAVQILHKHKVSLRLLAVRLPDAEIRQRQERVRREAKQRGRPVSQKKLDLCQWNILVTNAPASLLAAEEACVVRRVRWQIELVFKVFKSEGQIDQTRSQQRWRVLCELYAKLLGMVVQHWVLLAAGYVMLKHSARRAARRVRQRAFPLLAALSQRETLVSEVVRLAVVVRRRCRICRRKSAPSTFDRLRDLDPEFDQLEAAAGC